MTIVQKCPTCDSLVRVVVGETKGYKPLNLDRLYKAALKALEQIPPGPVRDELIEATLEVGGGWKR